MTAVQLVVDEDDFIATASLLENVGEAEILQPHVFRKYVEVGYGQL